MKAHTLGVKAGNEKGPTVGLPYDQRSIELDPNFAIGYASVDTDYSNMGQVGRANEYFTKAFQLREHASELEKLDIASNYYQYVTGELDKTVHTYQQEIESYPRRSAPYVKQSWSANNGGSRKNSITCCQSGMSYRSRRWYVCVRQSCRSSGGGFTGFEAGS